MSDGYEAKTDLVAGGWHRLGVSFYGGYALSELGISSMEELRTADWQELEMKLLRLPGVGKVTVSTIATLAGRTTRRTLRSTGLTVLAARAMEQRIADAIVANCGVSKDKAAEIVRTAIAGAKSESSDA